MPVTIRNTHAATVHTDPDRFVGQVGAAQTRDGEVLVVYNEARGRAHLDFDSLALIRSRDGGRSWDAESRTVVWACTEHFGSDTPSIAELADGTLLVNFVKTAFVNQKGVLEDLGPQSELLNEMREIEGVWLTRSGDGGATWSPIYKANAAPMRWAQPKDNVIEMPDGALLMPAEGQMFDRTKYAPNIHDPLRSFVLRSDDQGLHWEYYATVAYDAAGIVAFWEPSLARRDEGLLVCMMRTMQNPRNRHDRLWIATSDTGGLSWSAPRPTKLWGYPPDLIRLRDGRLLCTYGHRREPFGIRGCISDDGVRWDPADEFTIREGGTRPARQDVWWHIGYPTTIQLDDGALLSVFHEWTQEEPYVQHIVSMRFELA